MKITSKNRLAVVMSSMRIPFLTLVPVCVLLGFATAKYDGHPVNWLHLLLAFLGGLAAHASVNALNEYEDFKSGLDLKTERTPFSGGSGMLPARPEGARTALATGLVCLAVTVAIGVYFALVRGWAILPLGLLGLLVIVLYTGLLTRSPLLCLIAPGLGFGLFMVMGTHFALTGTYSWTAFAASLVPFFLVSDLLLLNQFPDREADRGVGRRHLVIAWGQRAGIWAYGLFLVAAYLSVVVAVLMKALPALGLLALLTLLLAVPLIRGVMRHYDSVPELIPFMGKNVLLNLLTPALLALGLFLG